MFNSFLDLDARPVFPVHKLKPRFGDQKMVLNGAELLRSLFLNYDESSNVTHFLLLDNFVEFVLYVDLFWELVELISNFKTFM